MSYKKIQNKRNEFSTLPVGYRDNFGLPIPQSFKKDKPTPIDRDHREDPALL